MKIAFLVTRLEKPSARYRVLQYIPLIESAGHVTELFTLGKSVPDRLRLFRKLRNFDIVFLQKKLLSAIEWYILRQSSRRLFYDFDDAVMFRDSGGKNPFSFTRKKAFARTARGSDVVIAGNEYLREFASAVNPRTFVVPTSVDMGRYTAKPRTGRSSPLVIGWIGSRTTLFYLEKMKKVLDTVYDKYSHVTLKIVSDSFFDCGRMPVIRKQWRYEEEIEDLHSFDIGLMPLTDDPWARGKCGFKLLQYMAVGVPAVCSPVGVNSEIITHGINGLWARDDGEWVRSLGTLIEDHTLRWRMGDMARETVLSRYSAESNCRKIIELFGSLRKQGEVI